MTEKCPHCGASVHYTTSCCPACGTDRCAPFVPTAILRRTPAIPRPQSITLISWAFIVCGLGCALIVCVGLPNIRSFILDDWELMAKAGVFMTFSLVYGIAMLNGKNWAREMYLWLTPFFGILSIFTGSGIAAMIPSLAIYLVLVRILTRPGAVAFFKQSLNHP